MMRLKNIITNPKTQKQITKLLYAAMACLGLLLIVEGLFQIPAIANLFNEEAIGTNTESVTTWVILWLLMFAQVTIIPIPALPIYVFCAGTNLVAYGPGLVDLFSLRTLFFVCFVVSACVVGSIAAYWLGRLGGGKAVKWIAGDEEEYNDWCKILNNKRGKIIYCCTLLFPLFPDDVICLVVGAMKMNFKFFVVALIIGKLIGSFCTLLFLRLPYLSEFFMSSRSGEFPLSIIVYGALLVLCIIATLIWKKVCKKNIV